MRTKKKFPKYHIDSPKYPTLRILYDNLAYQDAGFQANQIIIEFFDSYITDNSLNGKKIIRDEAIKHKISGGTEDIDRIRKKMAESYIVQTYNIAELFFKEFNKHFKKIHNITTWKKSQKIGDSDKKLDPLNQLIKNLDSGQTKKIKCLPEYLLCDYYRLLRNGYVHREIEESVSLKKPTDFYSKNITNHQGHFNKYYKTIPKTGSPAPNAPDKITFQDFILYSRALRNLANSINEICSISVEQAFKIAEEDNKFLITPKNINYHKYPNSKHKLDVYLHNYYLTHFGKSKAQIAEFTALFYDKY